MEYEIFVERKLQENTEVLGETLLIVIFSTTYPIRTSLGSNPGSIGKNPTTD